MKNILKQCRICKNILNGLITFVGMIISSVKSGKILYIGTKCDILIFLSEFITDSQDEQIWAPQKSLLEPLFLQFSISWMEKHFICYMFSLKQTGISHSLCNNLVWVNRVNQSSILFKSPKKFLEKLWIEVRGVDRKLTLTRWHLSSRPEGKKKLDCTLSVLDMST